VDPHKYSIPQNIPCQNLQQQLKSTTTIRFATCALFSMAMLALNATAMTAAETNTITTVVTEVDKLPSTTMKVVATVPPVAVLKSRQVAYDIFF